MSIFELQWAVAVKTYITEIFFKRFTFTPIGKLNLYHETKFFPSLSFTVYHFYPKISSFTSVLPIRIVLDSFYRLIFYSEKFSTVVFCRNRSRIRQTSDSSWDFLKIAIERIKTAQKIRTDKIVRETTNLCGEITNNGRQAKGKLGHVVQIHVCRLT